MDDLLLLSFLVPGADRYLSMCVRISKKTVLRLIDDLRSYVFYDGLN